MAKKLVKTTKSMGKKTQKQVKEVDLTAARDARCIPLAFEFLAMLSQSKGKAGAADQQAIYNSYKDVALAIMQRLLDEKVLITEIGYVQKVMMQIVEMAYGVVNSSLNDSLRRAETVAFGKMIADIRFDELDHLLKTGEKLDKVGK